MNATVRPAARRHTRHGSGARRSTERPITGAMLNSPDGAPGVARAGGVPGEQVEDPVEAELDVLGQRHRAHPAGIVADPHRQPLLHRRAGLPEPGGARGLAAGRRRVRQPEHLATVPVALGGGEKPIIATRPSARCRKRSSEPSSVRTDRTYAGPAGGSARSARAGATGQAAATNDSTTSPSLSIGPAYVGGHAEGRPAQEAGRTEGIRTSLDAA